MHLGPHYQTVISRAICILLVLVISTRSVAFVLPSYSFNVCDKGESCSRKLSVLVYLGQGGSDFTMDWQLNTDAQVTDEEGRVWVAEEPISLTFTRANTYIVAELTRLGYVSNAYQSVRNRGLTYSCPTESRCCVDIRNGVLIENQLQYNSTVYSLYKISRVRLSFDVEVQVTQGSLRQTLRLSDAQRVTYAAGMQLELAASTFDPATAFAISNDRIVMGPPDAVEGFTVQPYYISDDVQRIGIAKEKWLQSFQCSMPYGYLVSVLSGNVYDQFSQFRSNAFSDLFSGCTSKPDHSTQLNDFISRRFICQDTGMISILLQLSTDSIKLRRLTGLPFVTDSGLLRGVDSSGRTIAFIDIFNKDDASAGKFVVSPKRCCVQLLSDSGPLGAQDCASVSIQNSVDITVQPYDTKRFRFYLDIQRGIWQTGFCDFEVRQFGKVDLEHRLNFTMGASSSISTGDSTTDGHSEFGTPVDGTYVCAPPNRIMEIQGRAYCQSPCSADMEWNTASQICIAVDCKEKYVGFRDYFNLQTSRCEPTPLCDYDEEINEMTNECVKKKKPAPIDTSDPDTGPDTDSGGSEDNKEDTTTSEQTDDSGNGFLTDIRELLPEAKCEPNGVPTADKKSCICNAGWTTSALQDRFLDTVWCSIPQEAVHVDSNTTDANINFLPGETLEEKLGFMFGAIVAPSLLALIFSVVCCVKFIRYRRAKAKQRELLKWKQMVTGQFDAEPHKRKAKSKRSKRKKTTRKPKRRMYYGDTDDSYNSSSSMSSLSENEIEELLLEEEFEGDEAVAVPNLIKRMYGEEKERKSSTKQKRKRRSARDKEHKEKSGSSRKSKKRNHKS